MGSLYRRIAAGREDAGYGLIIVIGLMAVLTILITTLFGVVTNSLASSRTHQKYDGALATAESGIDQTLARLQRAYVYFGADYPVPNSGTTMDPNPACSGSSSSYTAPASFSSGNAERDWAKKKIAALIAANPSCLQHTSQGDFAVLKPSNSQTVYSEGWSPSYGAPHAQERLIKAEYLFAPYAPSNAVLTGCNLQLDSSTTVQSVSGADPTLAAIHSNCKITVANGNPSVTGPVSSSQDSSGAQSTKFSDNTNGVVTTTPTQDVPVISAREVYDKEALDAAYSSDWYDMCPDGTVRSPASTPCTGTTLTTLTSGTGQWRGFRYYAPPTDGAAATWLLTSAAGDGVYYFQAGNVCAGTYSTSTGTCSLSGNSGLGNPSSNAVTIIAAAAQEGQCLPVGGSIEWDHNDIAAPFMNGTFMIADHNLITGSNFDAGGGLGSNGSVNAGMFVAGDQINMQTGSTGAYGSVIAADQCAPVSTDPFYIPIDEIKNPSIYYDPNAEAPFTDIIDTTLWLEYPG